MAKQKGFLRIEGPVGEYTFYKLLEGYLIEVMKRIYRVKTILQPLVNKPQLSLPKKTSKNSFTVL